MTSNEKSQSGEEMFEDVEGHGRRFGMAEQPAEDDTEGHGRRFGMAEQPAEDGDGDDTEGHGVRVRI